MPHTTNQDPSPVGPVALWLLLQLGALALALTDARLSQNFPTPPESMALPEMIVVQMVGAAVFFAYLFRAPLSSLAVVGSSVLFALMGMSISGRLWIVAIRAVCVAVPVWLAGVACWRWALRTRLQIMIGQAVLTLITLAGPVMWYLQIDFSGADYAGDVNWGHLAWQGPILGILTMTYHEPHSSRAIGVLAAMLVSGLIAVGVRVILDRKGMRRSALPATDPA